MKTDTRPVRGKGGRIILSPSACLKGQLLCEWCSAETYCSLPANQECRSFLPGLVFREPIGLEDTFSTFRLGHAWKDRVRPGSIIGLHKSSRRNERFGLARVTRVEYGTIKEMMLGYAETNHMMIAQGVTGKEAARKLTLIVRQIFGPRMIPNLDKNATVIFSERIKDENSRLFSAWPLVEE